MQNFQNAIQNMIKTMTTVQMILIQEKMLTGQIVIYMELIFQKKNILNMKHHQDHSLGV